jgi:TolB-like protein
VHRLSLSQLELRTVRSGSIVRSFAALLSASLILATAAFAQAPATATAAPSAKPNIAVLTFEGDATSTPEQRAAISDRLQMELIKSGAFRVLDRSKVDEILREQGFQQAGVCSGTECQVEVGKLLGVEKLIGGKVVNFGDAWSLSATLTDVGSGQIEVSEAEDVQGKLFDVLSKGCPTLAYKLAGVPAPHSGGAATLSADSLRQAQAAAAATQSAAAAKASKAKSSAFKWILGGGMLAAGAGMVAFGYLQDKAVTDKIDEFNALPADADFTAARADVQATKDEKIPLRNLGYGLGAASLLGGLTVVIVF